MKFSKPKGDTAAPLVQALIVGVPSLLEHQIRYDLSMKFDPEICQMTFQSAWGPMTLAASPMGLCGAWFEQQKHFPNTSAWPVDMHNPFLKTAQKLLEKFGLGLIPKDTNPSDWLQDLPIDISAGTTFQQTVWLALMRIPMGQTFTYGQLAQSLGKPSASRAVGTAVGRNPISVLIPCHRVIGSQGQMTGYAGGLWRKEALLHLEAQASSTQSLKAILAS
jgi:methylated-DNA-[protein]-cysteine S-methyltransferase